MIKIMFFLLLFVGEISGQTTVNLPAIADASIDAGQANSNKGSLTYLESYPWGGTYSRRFLMKFDLSSIPSGATITSAKVKLVMFNTNGHQRTINSHLISTAWDEYNVTWNSFASQYNSAVSASSQMIYNSQNDGEWDVTNDVQSIVDGSVANNGWLFKDDSDSDWGQQFWFFNSREASASQPVLEITYTESVTQLQITSSHNNISCFGSADGTASVSVSGGSGSYTYSWSPTPNMGQGTNSISGLYPGLWEVTVTDIGGNNIQEVTSVTITEPSGLDLSFLSSNASCATCSDGSIEILGTGGVSPYQYSIDGGSSFQAGEQFSNLAPGSFDLKIKDNNGCESLIENGQITFAPLSVSLAIQNASCAEKDGSAVANGSGGFPPYTYLWSNGETGNSVNGLKAGSLNLTVTDDQGATEIINVVIPTEVVWGELVNMEVNPDESLTKTSQAGWDGVAYSSVRLPANQNGAVILDVPNQNASFMIGLTNGTSHSSQGIQYGIGRYGADIEVIEIKAISEQHFYAISYFENNDNFIKVERIGDHITFVYGTHGSAEVTELARVLVDPNESLGVFAKLHYQNTVLPPLDFTFCSDQVILSQEFYQLKRKLDDKYVDLTSDHLNFFYFEEYSKSAGDVLSFKIKDWTNTVIYSSADESLKVVKGKNKFTIDCIANKLGVSEGYYILEIENSKSEKSYLRFKINSASSCQ